MQLVCHFVKKYLIFQSCLCFLIWGFQCFNLISALLTSNDYIAFVSKLLNTLSNIGRVIPAKKRDEKIKKEDGR
jgi:hypothetical protein